MQQSHFDSLIDRRNIRNWQKCHQSMELSVEKPNEAHASACQVNSIIEFLFIELHRISRESFDVYFTVKRCKIWKRIACHMPFKFSATRKLITKAQEIYVLSLNLFAPFSLCSGIVSVRQCFDLDGIVNGDIVWHHPIHYRHVAVGVQWNK